MTTLLVANDGGHLMQLHTLRPRLGVGDDVVWVTPRTPQTESLLAGERVHWALPCPPRDTRALARTTLGRWTVGTRVNLERSLRLGDEMGGHIVTGHVDGIARIVAREDFDGMARFDIRAPQDLARFIAEKGSVALDGTSLTVNSIENDVFSILLIPHTLAVTTWGDRRAGDDLNLEVDLMARYAGRLMETR